MPPLEVAYLVDELLTDPSSHLAAATAGLSYPWSREAGIAADLYDLTAAIGVRGSGSSLDPYPRPLPGRQGGRTGGRARVDPEAVQTAAAAARAAGWSLPDDVVTRRLQSDER